MIQTVCVQLSTCGVAPQTRNRCFPIFGLVSFLDWSEQLQQLYGQTWLLCPPLRDQMESRILLLLILTSSVWAGTFELNQTQNFYQALENQNITLEWTFTLRRLLRYYQVYCEHVTGPRISVVLHMEHGVQYPHSQNQHFTGRVQFDADAFREGRLRVHVSRLQTQDSGLYRCNVDTDYGSNVGKCRLNVSAAAMETQTLRPGTERPGPDVWGRTFFIVLGLTVVLLVIIAATAVCLIRTIMRNPQFLPVSSDMRTAV